MSDQLLKFSILIMSVLALIYVTFLYSKKQTVTAESERELFNYDDDVSDHVAHNHETHHPVQQEIPTQPQATEAEPVSVKASEPTGSNEVFEKISTDEATGEFGLSGNQFPSDCFPKDQLTPSELLPGDANSKWAQSVPAGQGELGDQNFLTSGHHVGVNTVGQTLRNANRQLRSEPPNPQVKVSPWLQTTIEADTNRRPLEIGGC